MKGLLVGAALIGTLLFGHPRESYAQIGSPKISDYDRDRRELPTYRQYRFYTAIPPRDIYGGISSIDVNMSTGHYLLDMPLPYADVALDFYPDDFKLFGREIGLCGRVDIPLGQWDHRDMMPRVSVGPKLEKYQKERALFWRPRIEFYGYKPYRLANYMTAILGKNKQWFIDSHNGIGPKIEMENGFQKLRYDKIGIDSYTTLGYRIDDDNSIGLSAKVENSQFCDAFLRYNNMMKRLFNTRGYRSSFYTGAGIDRHGHFEVNIGGSMSLGRSKKSTNRHAIDSYNQKIETQRLQLMQQMTH
jgi:hypothetical protein